MEYKIEQGIPIPANKYNDKNLKSTIKRMEVGDSLYINNKNINSVRSYASFLASVLGVKVITKAEGDGARVWRVA